MYYPLTKRAKDAQERKKSLYQLQYTGNCVINFAKSAMKLLYNCDK